MSPIPRDPKVDDQVNINNATVAILELVKTKPEIDYNQWAAAMISIFMGALHGSDYSYDSACHELDLVKEHFKKLWFPDAQVD